MSTFKANAFLLKNLLVPVPGAFDKYKKQVSLMYDLKEEDIRRHACYQVQSRVERAGADTS